MKDEYEKSTQDVTIHYDGEFKNTFTITCDCGHRFDFRKRLTGYCPECGGKIVNLVADNIPIEKVPDGYKYYIFGDDTYAYEYFHDDTWNERLEYLARIYTPDEFKINEHVFYGWCYEHSYTPIFYRKNEDKTYMGYENTKGNFVKLTKQAFNKRLIEEVEKITTKR